MIGEPRHPALKVLYAPAHRIFGLRTLTLAWFDMLRLRARMRHPRRGHVAPASTRLHVGCGTRQVEGWLNVDVIGSEYDVDLQARQLPWTSSSFDTLVSQHVIEHLELFSELMPLLREFRRIIEPGGSVWLSCPDMERVCRAYADGQLQELLDDRQSRDDYSIQGAPVSQLVNDLFHQYGEHKNLYDLDLLRWALEETGFTEVRRIAEADLRSAFPEFPQRNDDQQTLYVTALAP
ncbi:MAG: methyltransferase domain-containing protein [Solirubrobacterales bacterium]|nr:methyltransferase domain-containing protein [Solirubrobacterales bacterium]